jgi:hypothetical protein
MPYGIRDEGGGCATNVLEQAVACKGAKPCQVSKSARLMAAGNYGCARSHVPGG